MEKGLTEDELDAAKQGIIGNFPLSLKNNSAIAGVIANLGFYDLPLDYLDTFRATIDAVTLEEINRVARRIYQPEELHFVVVGQPDGVESTN